MKTSFPARLVCTASFVLLAAACSSSDSKPASTAVCDLSVGWGHGGMQHGRMMYAEVGGCSYDAHQSHGSAIVAHAP